jgi:DNA-binding NarL/FixJ family response regulator
MLADDQAWLRSAVRLLLEQEPDVTIVGEVGDVETLLATSQELEPDLLLLDWELPGLIGTGRGHLLVSGLRDVTPCLKIVVLSGRPEAYQRAMDAGANAFVSKSDPPEVLLAALQHARDMSGRPPGAGDDDFSGL